MQFVVEFVNSTLNYLLFTIGSTAFVWLPFALFLTAWNLWRYYTRVLNINSIKWVLLEVKLPRELLKSPQAMEVIAPIFSQNYEGNLWDQYWKGVVRAWFSLEIVSLGGEIHFYVRTQKFFKNLIEAQFYSQYPDIEMREVEDYVNQIPPYGTPGSDWGMWGAEWKLAKEDAYPIKTYVDYGLHDNPKEEHKIDPMTPMLEYLSSISVGEQIWIQILVMMSRDRFHKPGTWFKKQDWRKNSADLVKKLMKRDEPREVGKFPERLSPGEEETVEAVERSLSKLGLDTGIRTIYLAKKDRYNALNQVGIMNSFKQYSSLNLNGFKTALRTGFEYKWQDPWGKRVEKMKRKVFDAYVRRSWFYPPHVRKPFVLNVEELATIYHFPGEVARTPTLERVESKRGEPPSNLPL